MTVLVDNVLLRDTHKDLCSHVDKENFILNRFKHACWLCDSSVELKSRLLVTNVRGLAKISKIGVPNDIIILITSVTNYYAILTTYL